MMMVEETEETEETEEIAEATTTAKAFAELDAQGAIAPGVEGWWKVWGARPYDVKAGDLVLYDHTKEGSEGWALIEDTFTPKAYPIRVGWVAEGEKFTMGAGVPIIVLRRGTHHTLADSV